MKFTYVAVNDKNRKYKGEMDADSSQEVIKNLQERGMVPLTIDVVHAGPVAEEDKSIWEKDIGGTGDIHNAKIKKKRVLTFMHQMAMMMRAGISLSIAMDVMLDTEKDKSMKKILIEITQDLYGGVPLSASMAKFKAFPPLIVNIVQAGEANGRLDNAFEQCARILDKEMKLHGKIVGAMIYPIFLVILTIGLIIVMSVVVLPQFKTLFNNFGSELPAITRFMMGTSDFLINYWYVLILVVGIIIAIFSYLGKKVYSYYMWWAQAKLKIPLIGNVLRLSAISRFCRMMSTLSDAGVSILRALELSRDVTPNVYMRDCINQIIEDVKIGTPINVAMSRYPVFDSLLVSMLRVGEESGMLSDSLNKMADMYEEQSDEAIKRMTDAMTPIMTILIAVVVGTVVVSIVTPMFGMYDVILGNSK